MTLFLCLGCVSFSLLDLLGDSTLRHDRVLVLTPNHVALYLLHLLLSLTLHKAFLMHLFKHGNAAFLVLLLES